jgi:hypothetical protein
MTETKEHDEMAETTSDEGAPAAARSEDAPRGGVAQRVRSRERVNEKETRISEERRLQAEEAFTDFRHLRGCPEEGRLPGDADSRVEFYPATKPRDDEGNPAQRKLVLRCIECGEAEVLDDKTEE